MPLTLKKQCVLNEHEYTDTIIPYYEIKAIAGLFFNITDVMMKGPKYTIK